MAVPRNRSIVVVLALALVAACGRSADAQTLTGNMFAGAGAFNCCGGATGAWLMGVGLDVPLASQVSVSGEFGLLGSAGTGRIVDRDGYGYVSVPNGTLLSFNGRYHFNLRDARRPRPFLTAGLGAALGSADDTGGLNVGGGIDWWTKDRRGVRLEVRDQFLGEFGNSQVVTARVALILR
jgi:hypothetical protein